MPSFWTACDARGPLILEVERGDGSPPTRHAFDRPSVLVGGAPRADLWLDHPEVSQRHALLQVIAGHLFCVDLESRTGTQVEGGGPAGGWVAPGQPIRIGEFRVRMISHLARGDGGPPPGWNPLATRDRATDPEPPTLEVAGRDSPDPIPIRRTLTLIGRSPRCKLRLDEPSASRFHGALLREADGLWVIDLGASESIAVNGVHGKLAKLEPGDELWAGPLVARVAAGPDPYDARILARSNGMRRTGDHADGPSPFMDLRPVLSKVPESSRDPQFNQSLLMLTQMFGSMHREMVELVREELEQIRLVTAEMQLLRAGSASTPISSGRPSGPPAGHDSPRSEEAERPRDPGAIHLIVGERLAAFEKERQGRWNKISQLLLKTQP